MSKRVLVVDDDEGVAYTIENFLKMKFGADCVTFTKKSCGDEALTWLASNKPDWAVLDLVLNGVSGFMIMHTIIEKYPGIPILIISGCAEGSDEINRARNLTMQNLDITFASKMSITKTLLIEADGVLRTE